MCKMPAPKKSHDPVDGYNNSHANIKHSEGRAYFLGCFHLISQWKDNGKAIKGKDNRSKVGWDPFPEV